MKHIKKFKKDFYTFCKLNLTNLTDDNLIKFNIYKGKIFLIQSSKFYKNKSILTDSARFNSIEIFKERIIANTRFLSSRTQSIKFKWKDVSDDIIQFIYMCEYTYGLTKKQPSIIFVGNGDESTSLSINDLENLDDKSEFWKIYINVIA